ncbi:uncharacterized protein RSE6_11186 [Rhynchosporium secalis]|uniref:WHIM1 domain-containing protein n=1 Tax=Rhynchosporium secalis TaxID=38038 RepID=A0A1E1MMC5_RHYSE|nr:uncharacterized protein RSE6_11186 [Rhynchosporium secalis]
MSSGDESSELSSVSSDIENDLQLTKKDGILKFFSTVPHATVPVVEIASPPRKQRAPSPPHELVLADNPDIAVRLYIYRRVIHIFAHSKRVPVSLIIANAYVEQFICMFRSRFTEAFPKSLINFGPQELERDIVESIPGEGAEQFLCAVLGLLLNRKQDVKSGHYNRALEEAIQTHKSQWAKDWEAKNPLSGGATFASMLPTQRLTLLRTLILWALSSSDAVKGIIQASYKQNRHEDDLNQPLSVQPWGCDSDKRRYYLIEGLDDTHFRVYRESSYMGLKRTWWSVAGDIDELKVLAQKLADDDGGQKARLLSSKMMAAVPRFEATEEKRKRREYRQTRKQQFKRPEPNYSMYEGRTRGKRMKYTYSDEEEDMYSDSTNARRSTRNTGTHTPAEPSGPTITQSGRQVKLRQGGTYGETMLSGQAHGVAVGGYDGASDEPSHDEDAGGRPPRRAAAISGQASKSRSGRHIEGYNDVDEMTSDDEGDASEQDYGDDEEEDDNVPLESDVDDQDEQSDEDEEMEDVEKKKLIVKLTVKTPSPDHKSTIKLKFSPRKSPDKDASSKALFPGVTNGTHAPVSIADIPATLVAKDTVDPAPSPASNGATTHISQVPTQSTALPPKSPHIQAPHSPLAIRSPEKPSVTYTASVDVGK